MFFSRSDFNFTLRPYPDIKPLGDLQFVQKEFSKIMLVHRKVNDVSNLPYKSQMTKLIFLFFVQTPKYSLSNNLKKRTLK